ncbi:hypothetical protein HELRODRAFT_82866 [Helobdella robusta]|uniref:Uncharacterized protein n=1 Tax=Helobdella robusta TaxID=6412 RepID=T1G4X6_HELRO|nr:hypothetical protein HELRODRAFT_82866 [Helobdella robusta]ESO00646.1 hypothetical protein HELRODRAFT_82866 [Helobdella robusta]
MNPFNASTTHCCYILLLVVITRVQASHKAKKLYSKLFESRDGSRYNKYIRPVERESDVIDVYIGLKLSQLIDVDEKNQYMTTNVWMLYEWVDPTLKWDPANYDGVLSLYVPAVSIWHPDIILYNTADGTYEPTNGTNAILWFNGTIMWSPPASFKVGCTLDVTYFPFDQQDCGFQFASWTYNRHEVGVWRVLVCHDSQDYDDYVQDGIDLSEFYQNVEWDLMAIPAQKTLIHYAGSREEFTMWTFNMQLRRKFLFYTVNLLIPLISHALITVLVFYIPAASTEKMALSINILLSLTVFFLMLAEIVPVTSLVVPLLGKYLVFTLLLVVSSIAVTIITYQLHFRSASTHSMHDWTRKIFLYWMPKFLMMERPKVENSQDVYLKYIKINICNCLRNQTENMEPHTHRSSNSGSGTHSSTRRPKTQMVLMNLTRELDEDTKAIKKLDLSIEVQRAIQGALYISNHLKKEDQCLRTKEDWKYVALVVDRILLWAYAFACGIGSIAIICQAPMLFDYREPVLAGKH